MENKMNKKAAGTRVLIINIAMVIVFAIFMLYFALGFPVIQNPNSTIVNQTHLEGVMGNMTNSLSNFSKTASSVYNQAGSSAPSATDYLFLIFQGAFYIPFTFLSFAFSGIGTIMTLIFVAFGGGMFGTIVVLMTGLVGASLTITLVLYIVKSIRTGQD